MKKKIIIAVIAITVIVSALAICSSAYNYDDYVGTTLPSGSVITFKSNPTLGSNTISCSFKTNNNTQYNQIRVTSTYVDYRKPNTDPVAYDYGYSQGSWYGTSNTITLTSNLTLSASNSSRWFIENAVSGFPALPEPEPEPDENIENVLDNAKATFNTSLNVTSVIIAWLMANTLALCGLYLYILVALIGIAVRFFKK